MTNKEDKLVNVLYALVDLYGKVNQQGHRITEWQNRYEAGMESRQQLTLEIDKLNQEIEQKDKALSAVSTWQPIGTAPVNQQILVRGGFIKTIGVTSCESDYGIAHVVITPGHDNLDPFRYIVKNSDVMREVIAPKEWLPILG